MYAKLVSLHRGIDEHFAFLKPLRAEFNRLQARILEGRSSAAGSNPIQQSQYQEMTAKDLETNRKEEETPHAHTTQQGNAAPEPEATAKPAG